MRICPCCQVTEETFQPAVEAIQANPRSERSPHGGYWFENAADEPREVCTNADKDDLSQAQPAKDSEDRSCEAPTAQGSELTLGPVLKLTFQRPNGVSEDVNFYSRPLCVRFSKSIPITVTHVGMGFAGSARVNVSWVLTHVNSVELPNHVHDAATDVRLAINTLPRTADVEGDSPRSRATCADDDEFELTKLRTRSEPPRSASKRSEQTQQASLAERSQSFLDSLPKRSTSLDASLMWFDQSIRASTPRA